jgi:hypothetical protein
MIARAVLLAAPGPGETQNRRPLFRIMIQATELRDDVRRDLVLDEGNAVTQLQLAFFQPLQPQQIRCGRLMQRINRRVEIAVLLLQPCELGFKFALIFIGHGAR